MIRRRVKIAGVVQGVGFRPYLYCLATQLQLSGEVANGTGGVVLEIEGETQRVEEFLRRLPLEIPPLAQIESVAVEELAASGAVGFRITSSDASGHVSTQIPADAATCGECLREMLDAGDRRYRYPFINCTHCGPRFTITRSIPYDRPQTSMARFTMCAACQAEYDDPRDRRFHAQPNACWECGPRMALSDADGAAHDVKQPVEATLELLREGKIVAVKGIGGFHLVVDATNQEAVVRLRGRKHRFGKPLAVMVRDLDAVRRLCAVSDAEAVLLTSTERPIVLLRALGSHGLAAEIAPGVPWLGVFLPYAPVHHLLLGDEELSALVMTSANLSEEPIAIANDEAVERLHGIADAFLMHDREILQRADDSVMCVIEGAPQFLRRSRGHVPLPVRLPMEAPPLLAVGGHLKSVFTLATGHHAYQSQHLGDLETVASLDFFAEALEHFERIFQIVPEYVVHDLHPGYASTAWAMQQPQATIAVQHHHAHIAGCMAEHALSGPVIGLALDGTGYGADGCVWGGEVLITTLTGYERYAQLKYAAMPGSEAAVRQPWRMALGHLYAALGEGVFDAEILAWLKVSEQDARLLARMIDRGVNSPLTSSCGRMFDAAAALILGRDRVDYEAQAAIELEGVAEVGDAADVTGYGLRLERDEGGPLILNPAPMWEALIEDIRLGTARGVISTRFHVGVANAYVEAAIAAREETGIRDVCLGGGVFHNRLLTGLLCRGLGEAGMVVHLPVRVSPGDGGLSYGQAAVAAALLAERR
jgi:hydrogenase maturation protein HypF